MARAAKLNPDGLHEGHLVDPRRPPVEYLLGFEVDGVVGVPDPCSEVLVVELEHPLVERGLGGMASAGGTRKKFRLRQPPVCFRRGGVASRPS